LDISPASGNKSMPARLAAASVVVVAEAEDPSLLWWLKCPFGGVGGSPGGAWQHWRPRDQVCATAEVACNQAVPVRRTKV
jgi:hypothetical protein